MRANAIRRLLYSAALVALDVGAFTLAFFLAVKVRILLGQAFEAIPDLSGDAMRFDELYFMPGLFLLTFYYEGLYRRRTPFIDELRDIAKAIALLTILLFALISIGKLAHIVSRLTIVMMAPFALLFVAAFRYWGKILLHRMGLGCEKLLIIGDCLAALKFKNELLAEKTLGYQFAGYVPIDAAQRKLAERTAARELPVTGNIAQLTEILQRNRIECALIAAPGLSRDKTSELADRIHRYVQHVLLIPEMRSGALLNSELYHLFVNQLFLIKMRNSLREDTARLSKLAFDYSLVILSLPFIIPVLGVIALLVRFSSPGPALYTQLRVGHHGKPIRVYKFRSMYRDADARLKDLLQHDAAARAEWKKHLKLKNDPRVTRLGSFLRKSSLDELPQLINVLKGEMSLVGPRPVPEQELNERYKDKSDYYKLVRPGMTGLWQISGRSDVSYEQRVDMDTWYIFNWSLYIDFVILYKTLGVVLKKRGAY